MKLALPVSTTPRCPRCRGKLAYEGRPCPVCISPARFTFAAGVASDIQGDTRASGARLPRFALPSALRGRTARLPARQRVINTFRIIGRWTWNSLAIAAALHLFVLSVAFLMRGEIQQFMLQVQQVRLEDRIAAPPPPEADSSPLPAIDSEHDELQVADEVSEDDLEIGEPDDAAPPEPHHMPAPPLDDPRPEPALKWPTPPNNAPQGLDGGLPGDFAKPSNPSGLFKNRQGESRAAAVRRYGGGDDTESAVNSGLEYLARQQSADGSWDPNKGFETPPSWARYGNGYRGKVTALCALPFLAAGHTPDEGRYRRNIRNALRWLMRQQTSDGCVTYHESADMYTHTVATLALCEAYGLGRDREIGRAAEAAVRFLERTQGSGGGWDYTGYITSPGTASGERNDGSITGWAVLALKSARSAGIPVSDRVWMRMIELYDRLSLDSGETYYADRAYGRLPATRRGIGMTGVGLASRIILDDPRFAARNRAAEKLLLEHQPKWDDLLLPSYGAENPNFNTFYGWYYSTLGMFLRSRGEGQAWQDWNDSLKKALLANQVGKGTRRGSWPAADRWIGTIMGDLYSTACAVLCLEVYYRYDPAHRLERGATANVNDREARRPESPTAPATPATRSAQLRELAREQGASALPDLLRALRDPEQSVRVTALLEITKLKHKDAAPDVAQMLSDSGNDSLKHTILDTLGRLGDRSVYPSVLRLLADPDRGVQDTARETLKRLADGKDFGFNKRAWRDWFERNSS